MILNESVNNFKDIIREEYNVQDATKLAWMSQVAQIHAIHESQKGISILNEGVQSTASIDGGIYTTPLNTMGMGNQMLPNNGIVGPNSQINTPGYQVGSGDIPMSTLTTALEIANATIGFDLVTMVPASGPMAFLTFTDFPYAGGKLGRINETSMDGVGEGADNKPIYIKVSGDLTQLEAVADAYEKQDEQYPAIKIASDNGIINGLFLGTSRIDSNIIVKIESVKDAKETANISIAKVFGTGAGEVKLTMGESEFTLTENNAVVRPELVKGVTDHVQSFSNFFGDGTGKPSDDPMSRAENETGVGNTIGARIFTKVVRMDSFEVTGAVTRQQLQDMPLYGVDVVAGVLETMQNELSQAINNRILDRVFRLGVDNYKNQRAVQKVDLNLYIASAGVASTKKLSGFAAYKKYVGTDNQPVADANINNAIQNTAAENVTTHQRRIMTRMLAASNLISNVSRRGRAHWAVMNTQLLTALQDCSQFVVAPMRNSLIQGGDESLYYAGDLAGMAIYVDPLMKWNDTRICIGRRASVTNNKVNGAGVVFMPYILADQVQIIAEGTMAPKMLMNSRYAIVDCGFYPEQNYYTFMVDVAEGMII